MRNNQYTIFISPPRAGKSSHFSLHIGTFYSLVFIILIFIIGDYIAILKYFESEKLAKENSTLKNEKEELEKTAKIVEEIEKNESFIKDFLGLEHNGSNMGGLGQGGERSDMMVDEPFINAPDPQILTTPKGFNANQKPVERALDLNRNLEGIIDALLDRKSEWDTKPSILPVETDRIFVSSVFGWRLGPFTGRREFHRGIDISSRRGTPIIAPADGIVSETGKDRSIGNFIRIKHNETFATLYGHLLKYGVTPGQKVKRGELIGLMGNTGMSTGHHLHYEVHQNEKPVNPNHYILNAHIPAMVLAQQ